MEDPTSNPTGIDDSELELYTIPSHSRWFLWDEIHETEKTYLKDFFDGTSISRTPKIYKEYRDFIINKYREEPSRRLTFTEVRKSLVGDVCLLNKVFLFLEKWGLINYAAPPSSDGGDISIAEIDDKCKVKIEEGPPNGIRVAALPNSLKPISVPRNSKNTGDVAASAFKLPRLASYSDVYGDLLRQKELICGVCSNKCDSGHYKSTQDNFIICGKCFENGKYGEKRSMGDFKLNESSEGSGKHEAVWTEAEIILLLESVLKHGDDWELVAQNVQTKTKLDCISKLIELPFGEFMLGSGHSSSNSANGIVNSTKQVQSSSSNHQGTSTVEDQIAEHKNENEQNGDVVRESPLKKQRVVTPPLSDSSSSLMKQVGLISSMVDPHITAAAADAAVTALCDENLCPREIFDVGEDYASGPSCSNTSNGYPARVLEGEGSDMERSTHLDSNDISPEKDDIPLTLRIRAAIATALGAAAARAKLLADQEDREIEHLVATIIEAQIEKLQHKTKHFEELEALMEKEHTEMEELKNSLLTERIDVLERTFSAGVSRWKDYPSVKS